MNKETKDSLIEFINAIEQLTHGVLIHIGMETASDVINKCEKLKKAVWKE